MERRPSDVLPDVVTSPTNRTYDGARALEPLNPLPPNGAAIVSAHMRAMRRTRARPTAARKCLEGGGQMMTARHAAMRPELLLPTLETLKTSIEQ